MLPPGAPACWTLCVQSLLDHRLQHCRKRGTQRISQDKGVSAVTRVVRSQLLDKISSSTAIWFPVTINTSAFLYAHIHIFWFSGAVGWSAATGGPRLQVPYLLFPSSCRLFYSTHFLDVSMWGIICCPVCWTDTPLSYRNVTVDRLKGRDKGNTSHCHDADITLVVQLLSCVLLFATHGLTIACQASLSFTISWNLLKLMSIDSVMPSNHFILCCPLILLPSTFPASVGWLFALGGQSTGTLVSSPVFQMNTLDWFPLGLTGLIALLFKGLSRVFSNTTV